MSTRWNVRSLIALLAVCGALMLFAAETAEAQSTAVVTGLTGQVRIIPKGETAWRPLQLGMRVAEGADIAAAAGGRAELRLPDGSTLMVVENTRFVVTKLDYDQQNRLRSSFFHLAAGKLRGFVNKAAATLVAARQANFAITTPTAVAAVRGTTVFASFDAATGQTTFLVTEGVAMINFGGRVIQVSAGQILQVSPATPPAQAAPAAATAAQVAQVTSTANPATAGTPVVLGATAVQVTDPGEVTNIVVTMPAPTATEPAPVIVVAPPPPAPTVTLPGSTEPLPEVPSGS